jgi:hypothetical protein
MTKQAHENSGAVRGTRYDGGAKTLSVKVKVEQAGRPGQGRSQTQS